MKESYIKEEFVNEYGIKTIVMGIRDVDPVEAARRIVALRESATETFADGSFVIETEEFGLCCGCRDHAAVVECYNADAELEEELSNCCGTGIHTF